MEIYKVQIAETLITVALYVVGYFITKYVLNNSLKKAQLERTRRKIIIKGIHLMVAIAVAIVIAGIWGVEQNELAVFASTLLTALGIAFFAQWSLLSNITSGIILFFNHPLKLGDHIKVLDKEYPIEGEIVELTYFFIHLKTEEGQILTMPNSLILQKGILVKEHKT
ncbi:MAG: mechanosensitive ion channel family protein [Cytophagaceae bacterium]|jgi:small-conductance mechanosensitive channel|nr:mechanosensitive ion channel family protein [Cytophagaceae bacterium]